MLKLKEKVFRVMSASSRLKSFSDSFWPLGFSNKNQLISNCHTQPLQTSLGI